MNIFEQIAAKRVEIELGVQSNIEKSFDTDIEKAVYADTAENRKLGRVGQKYKRGKDKKNKQNFHAKGVTSKLLKYLNGEDNSM